jgi:hypothetical protein
MQRCARPCECGGAHEAPWCRRRVAPRQSRARQKCPKRQLWFCACAGSMGKRPDVRRAACAAFRSAVTLFSSAWACAALQLQTSGTTELSGCDPFPRIMQPSPPRLEYQLRDIGNLLRGSDSRQFRGVGLSARCSGNVTRCGATRIALGSTRSQTCAMTSPAVPQLLQLPSTATVPQVHGDPRSPVIGPVSLPSASANNRVALTCIRANPITAPLAVTLLVIGFV